MKEYQYKDQFGKDYTAKVTEDNSGVTVEVFMAGNAEAEYKLHGGDETLTIGDDDYDTSHILYYAYAESVGELQLYVSPEHEYDEFDGDADKIEAAEDAGEEIYSHFIPMPKEVSEMIEGAISL